MNAMNPMLKLAAAFAAGALAVFCLDAAVRRRRYGDEAVARDWRLRERVKDEIAVRVSNPDEVAVKVEGGLVRVSGYVLAAEMDGLLSQLTRLPGVHKVHNALSPVADARRLEELRERALAQSDGNELRSQAYSGA
jgi:hypothetical protein